MNSLSNEIMNFYVRNFSETVIKMKNTEHGINVETPNPYHAEGDVWSHTVGVFVALKSLNIKNEEIEFIYAISALCHDVGKIVTRNVTGNKVTFYGHAEASVQHAIDVAYKFCFDSENNKYKDFWNEKVVSHIINLVGNHMKFYQIKENDYPSFVNYDTILLQRFNEFETADVLASFNIKENYSDKIYNKLDFKNEITKDEIDVWVYMGLPGSGKDTHASNSNLRIASLDKCRMRAYIKSSEFDKTIGLNSIKAYTTAYEYCRRKGIDLTPLLYEQIREFSTESYAICNTNLKSKSRKSMINIIKNCNKHAKIGCRYIVTPTEIAIERDQKRTFDKQVGKNVINQMGSSIEPPTMKEGFHCIEFIVS